MTTTAITITLALGLLASTAMAEPVELGTARLADVTAGYLDGSNVRIINVGGHPAQPGALDEKATADLLLDQLAAVFARVELELSSRGVTHGPTNGLVAQRPLRAMTAEAPSEPQASALWLSSMIGHRRWRGP